LMEICQARINGTQAQRPVLKPKKEIPHHIHAAGVVIRRIGREASQQGENPSNQEVLLSKRPSNGLLGGMWEFPNGRVKGNPAYGLEAALETGYRLKVKRNEALGTVKHAYTHFRVTVHAYRCELVSITEKENLKWVGLKELEQYPMGKVDRQIARMLDE